MATQEIETLFTKINSFIQRKIFRNYRARINYQYSKGGWEWLGRLDEQGHQSIMANYFTFLKRGGSILDMGSGEGILNDSIGKNNYSYYVGVDLSDQAAKIGQEKRGDEKTFFYQGNMDEYVPQRKFDVIAINEALYFSKNKLGLLKRLENYLEKDGFFIVSMVEGKGDEYWDMLSKGYSIADENRVTNINNVTWICRLLKPL
jgi:2-polyprenyl-6-hydroxyphenyl methylase/3-demethylubiquinone-9 3-methyltransferase